MLFAVQGHPESVARHTRTVSAFRHGNTTVSSRVIFRSCGPAGRPSPCGVPDPGGPFGAASNLSIYILRGSFF